MKPTNSEHGGLFPVIGITIAIVGNVLINVALNIQRYAHRRLQNGAENGDSDSDTTPNYLTSGFWWLGAFVMTIGEIGNFLAYGFAPASIVSPLGVFSLVSNCLIAPIFFHERITKRNVFGVFIAIVGILFIILSIGNINSLPDKNPYKWILSTLSTMDFKIYFGVTITCIILLLISCDTSGDNAYELHSLFINLLLVALFGAYTALATKALSSLLSFTFKRAFGLILTYVLMIIIASTAILQVLFLNRALQCFDATTVVPIHFALFTLSVITGSAVIFREFDDKDAIHTSFFCLGAFLTFIGVLITASRKRSRKPSDNITEGSQPEIVISNPASSYESLHGAAVEDYMYYDETTSLLDDPQTRQELPASDSVPTVPLTSSGMFIGTVLETRRGIKFLKSRSRSHNGPIPDNGPSNDSYAGSSAQRRRFSEGTRK